MADSSASFAFPPHTRRVLGALVDAVVPHSPGVAIDPVEPVVRWIEEMMVCFPRHLQRLFPVGLWVLEFLPPVFLLRPRRMSGLNREDRRRYVRGWLESRWSLRRDFIKGFTGIVLMGYYALPEVLRHLGIDHQEYLDRKRAEREKLLGHPIS